MRAAGHDSPAPPMTPLRRPNRPSSLQVYPPSAGNPFSVRTFAVSRATRSLRAGTEVRGAGAARRGRSCSSGAIGALLRRARWPSDKASLASNSSQKAAASADVAGAGLRGRAETTVPRVARIIRRSIATTIQARPIRRVYFGWSCVAWTVRAWLICRSLVGCRVDTTDCLSIHIAKRVRIGVRP